MIVAHKIAENTLWPEIIEEIYHIHVFVYEKYLNKIICIYIVWKFVYKHGF